MIAALVGIVASIGLTQPLTVQFPFAEFIAAREQFAHVLPLDMMAILFLLILLFVSGIVFWMTRSRKVILSRTWDCGTPPTSRTEITTAGFSRSLVTIFRGILRPTRQTEIEYHDENMRYFIKSQEIRTALDDPYQKMFYQPLHMALHFLASKVRHVHGGNINLYILYIFVTLIFLLVWTTRS